MPGNQLTIFETCSVFKCLGPLHLHHVLILTLQFIRCVVYENQYVQKQQILTLAQKAKLTAIEQLEQISDIEAFLTGTRRHYTLKSHLLLVHLKQFQFQIKRARFSLVFPTYVQFCTQVVVLYFLNPFQQPTFNLTSKIRPKFSAVACPQLSK